MLPHQNDIEISLGIVAAACDFPRSVFSKLRQLWGMLAARMATWENNATARVIVLDLSIWISTLKNLQKKLVV